MNEINEEKLGTIKVEPIVTKEVKICKSCGRKLPIEDFPIYGKGRRSICISCFRQENGASEKFKQFKSVELIDELKARGYKGVIKKVITQTFNL